MATMGATQRRGDMKLMAASLFTAAMVGCLLVNITPGQATSTAEWCQKAAKCSQDAQNERYDPDNPGLGKKFLQLKKTCQYYSQKCSGN
jgi:hypothetical protein